MRRLVGNIEVNRVVKRTSFNFRSKDCDFIVAYLKPLSLSTKAFVNNKEVIFEGTSVAEVKMEELTFNLEVKKGKVRIIKFCKYKNEIDVKEDPSKFDFLISGYLL